ncbi:hypothetical protein [Dictyobacter arantiisoli]|uniref:Uncharacterized protein n=1 Tax=Dictyobacter arantiisoli TaxID=2014874 RepID=A0A5A5TI72_9CHLR|nr:hypothetical protein [Dictyobacter arantiisoli]GCF10664.1 hypothetical protein KDI_42280 [Dictyobacter arantiisoli]
MSFSSRSHEVPPPPLEKIGDLIYSPGTDLPFGKRIRIGVSEQTIYESSVELGYRMGIRAHLAFMTDNNCANPVPLDDKQFTMIIDHLLPSDLNPFEQGLWRAHFVAGWMSVYLGLVSDEDDIDVDHDSEGGADIDEK